MGVINSTQSRNLCNAWNMCISVPFIISKRRRKKKSSSSYSHPNSSYWLARSTGYSSGSPASAQQRYFSQPSPSPRDALNTPAEQLLASQGSERPHGTNGHHCQGWTTLLQKAVAPSVYIMTASHRKIHLSCCSFGLQHRHTLPKCSVLNYYHPWWKKPMSKRFPESNIAICYYFTVYAIREP